MVQTQNGKEQVSKLASPDLLTWRLRKHEAEKREETVNREIMRRQFKH